MKLEELNEKYRVEGDDFWVSLNAATGKKIKDIVGYFSNPYGGGVSFGLSQIIFDDGTKVWVEGEHDWASIYGGFIEDLDEIEADEEED